MMSDIARFFESVDSGISGFPFVAIAAVGRVEDVVDDLKGETDAIAERTNAFQIRFGSSAQISANPDARTDERAGLGSVNGFELLFGRRSYFSLDIQNLAGDHSIQTAGRATERRDRAQHPFGRKIFRAGQDLKRECEQRVAGEKGDAPIEMHSTRTFAAAQ